MTPIEQALRELVSLKDLKDAAQALPGEPDGFGVRHIPGAKAQEMMAEYERRKPDAWRSARAAIASLEAQEPLPGWKLAPVEPNKTMRRAGGVALASFSGGWNQTASAVYRAMLAAAPSPWSGT